MSTSSSHHKSHLKREKKIIKLRQLRDLIYKKKIQSSKLTQNSIFTIQIMRHFQVNGH